MGECSITAIISPSQGEDGGSTPLTRFEGFRYISDWVGVSGPAREDERATPVTRFDEAKFLRGQGEDVRRFGGSLAMRKNMYYVYILQSLKDSRTYIGFCRNINKRIKEHNAGKVKATKNRRPLKIIYLEKASNIEEAKKREKYWKSGAGRRKLRRFFKEGFPPIIL